MMKHLKLFWFFIPCYFLISCLPDNNAQDYREAIDGSWNLKRASSKNVAYEYKENAIVWTFNKLNKTVTVVNNNNDPSVQTFLSSGNYSYSFTKENADGYISDYAIIINGRNYGSIFVSGNSFYILNKANGGYNLYFHR